MPFSMTHVVATTTTNHEKVQKSYYAPLKLPIMLEPFRYCIPFCTKKMWNIYMAWPNL